LPVARQLLHDWRLGFEHTEPGQRIEIEAPPAADLAVVPAVLRESE
jgi:hypothetical protein